MKLEIDTKKATLEDLQKVLSILISSTEEKGGKILLKQPQEEKKLNLDNAYVKRLVEQEKLMETIDLSNILQSDHGIQKRRQEALRKNI